MTKVSKFSRLKYLMFSLALVPVLALALLVGAAAPLAFLAAEGANKPAFSKSVIHSGLPHLGVVEVTHQVTVPI